MASELAEADISGASMKGWALEAQEIAELKFGYVAAEQAGYQSWNKEQLLVTVSI